MIAIDYTYGDKVIIKSLNNKPGKVVAVRISKNEILYEVEYWYDGELLSAMLYCEDLEIVEMHDKIVVYKKK